MTEVTLAMGATRDAWLSSEIHLAELHGALQSAKPEGWEFSAWSSRVRGPAWIRRRLCYPIDLRANVRGNLHLVDQSYADALLAYPDPAVVTVADIAFWRARGVNPLRGFVRSRIVAGVKRARRIIAISQATARELEGELGVPASAIRVIPFAISSDFFTEPEPLSQELRKLIGAADFLLHVGSLDPRKGFPRLLAALGTDPDLPPLVQVGGSVDASVLEIVDRHRLANRVVFLGRQPRPVLHSLYAASAALVFASSYEGFGVPPLEARASGTRVITTAMPSVVEVLGERPRLAEDGDAEAWAEAIRASLNDAAPRALSAKLREEWSWKRVARETLAVYREAFL